MSFSKNLVRLRRAKGLSQENLADELDLSRQSISKWELEVSKPDTENLIKLSKLFGVRIDDLIGNEVIDTEALSINVKEDTKKIKMLKIWRGVVISGLILFIIIVIYKFVMLFRITKIGEHYKELNNYYYEIKTYIDMNTTEKEECWYKDGKSKTVFTLYKDNNKVEENITYIDYINNDGFLLNNITNEKKSINVKEYLLFHDGYDRGAQLYSCFPDMVKNKSFIELVDKSLINVDVVIKECEKNIIVCLNNGYINLEKNTLLPVANYYEDRNNNKFEFKQYNVELNSVQDIKI